ncbi:hypothetical protein [Dethiobacter alkaliphilus]|uniref:Uncharacterized protein n=1 Tax=Dethiobacter alkaliphilus AHT 1 TaxID=555088 RepID=C0GIN8_DETAL|nr:hypothetical protein [Dethiobacter alkaliphilus]EEG76702.1 hypothetical protein DealDRAFT_2347 [Dethiobacter alkaliphilus AHT 1]MCW3490912.1 hypothetical protein [Dethiobacter alkaliphilus]
MSKENSVFSRVEEREVQGEVFQVTHRILQIPQEVYLQVLKEHEAPFSEMAAQEFVEQYLAWCNDTGGLIGMVRIDTRDDTVVLDAAIRYRINPLDRPSCQRE